MSQVGLFGAVVDPEPVRAPLVPGPLVPAICSRRVVCPARHTGWTMAEDVTPETWTDVGRAMAKRERMRVDYYEISAATGAWTLRGRVLADGTI